VKKVNDGILEIGSHLFNYSMEITGENLVFMQQFICIYA